ncbi:MAG: alpha/beta fold hydrolase, partial [Sciscionella sp.]
ALRSAVWRSALRGRADNQARACAHVLTAQFPMLPERRLLADGAAALERRFRGWAGRRFAATAEFEEMIRRNREAMLVPGVAHSALEYYRWAARAQLRSEGRRFAEEVDRRSVVPVLQLHGADDVTLLEATARESASWTGPRAVFHSLPDTGYFVHQEQPATTTTTLTEFFTR